MPLTQEERNNMIVFIKRVFKDKVSDDELQNDDDIREIWKEAYSCSEWGL